MNGQHASLPARIGRGDRELGDLRHIGAFFSFKFRATGGSFFAFSLIACFDARAKSQTSFCSGGHYSIALNVSNMTCSLFGTF